jgi:NAD dependent epimerase/dehydratase
MRRIGSGVRMLWSSRTVLVTGAAGFIGSHLVERLLTEGASVRALVRYNSSHTAGWLDDIRSPLRDGLDIRHGNILDGQFLDDVLAGCEVVFHLAALVSIPYSYIAPESYVDTNVRGTLNVLQSARKHGVRVIQTSTSEVYGTPETVPITEAHPLRPQSPYAASKVASDQLALSFHRSFGLPVTVLRPFNTYGPRQSTRAVLPAILSQLLGGSSELRLGALHPRRDLTYVSDTVDGFVKAAETESAVGRTIQLGTGRDMSVGELADLAIRMTASRARIVEDPQRFRPAASEVERLLSDASCARAVINWEPRVTLEDGMSKTIEWLLDNLRRYSNEYVV